MADRTKRSEFKVVIEGIEMPTEVLTRINGALQKAALTEIALIDLKGDDLVFRPIMTRMASAAGGNGGGTGGVHIIIDKLR